MAKLLNFIFTHTNILKALLLFGIFISRGGFAYDNPAGSNVPGNVTTADKTVVNAGQIGTGTNATGLTTTGTSAIINNTGTINGQQGLVVNGANSIVNNNSGGQIVANPPSVAGTYTAVTLNNANQTLNNNGSLSASGGDPTVSRNMIAIAVKSTGAVINNTSPTQIIPSSYSIGTATGIKVYAGASVATLSNSGSIFTFSSSSSSAINNAGTITTLNNSGALLGPGIGSAIINTGNITTLNNTQGGGSLGTPTGSLTYTGALPTNYNIIVTSTSKFGQLSASSATGSTNFGITSSTLASGTYSSVISGLTVDNFSGGLTGISGGYNYSLGLHSGSLTVWDLIVSAIINGGGGGDSGGGSSTTVSTPRYGNLTVQSGAITSTNNNAVINGTTVVIPSGSVVMGSIAVTNTGTTPGITNEGLVLGTNYGLVNSVDSTIQTLINTGTISGGTAGIQNLSMHTINLLINTGSILGGIDNTQGRIITLQNAQGGSAPLILSGNLPNNYQVIVNGLSSYGQLAVTKAAGQMTFGIATGSVVYTGLTYTSVLTGVGANNLLNTAGSSGGYLFKLTPETSGTVWNMTIGASVADTQSSLQSTASSLQTQYALQSNGVIAGLTYDCSLFGENGVCVSAGGRQTGSAGFINGTTSALIIGAYKVSDKIRVGGYLDQNLSASNPNGIISNSNSTPMGGLFAVWNDRDDGLGTEVKASIGYNNKGMTITRPVVGTSEPGSGSTALTSQGANVVAKYHFGLDNRTTVSPYVGARYLSTSMNGYSEGQASNVLVPLAYSSLSMNATTGLLGVGASHRLDEEVTLTASVGAEADMQTTNGSYTVTNVNGLSPAALNPNPNKVRPAATAAAYYKLHKDAQIGLSVLYRQDSMTGMSSTTGLVTYTMGM